MVIFMFLCSKQKVMASAFPVRRSTRRINQINYRKLNSGPTLQEDKIKSKTWSVSKLYSLVITDSKVIQDKLFVKVHYTDEGWTSTEFDEWRDASEIIDVPDCHTDFTPELRELFIEQLKTSVKESLHGQRKIDSVELPIPRKLLAEFASFGIKGKRSRIFIKSPSDLNCLLGAGDFSFIEPGTLSFYLKERKPLEEYSPDGSLRLIHRGFQFQLRCSRGIGNRYDFANFFTV